MTATWPLSAPCAALDVPTQRIVLLPAPRPPSTTPALDRITRARRARPLRARLAGWLTVHLADVAPAVLSRDRPTVRAAVGGVVRVCEALLGVPAGTTRAAIDERRER